MASITHSVIAGTSGVSCDAYGLVEEFGTEKGSAVAVISQATTALIGTLSSAGTAVTGVGTAFDTELSVGDVISVVGSIEKRSVVSIADATNLVVSSAFTTAISADTVVKADSSVAVGTVLQVSTFKGEVFLEDSIRETVYVYDTPLEIVGLES